MLKKTNDPSVNSPQEIVEHQLDAFRKKKDQYDFLKSIIVVVVICSVVFGFVIGIGRVHGDSMNPTLRDGDFVLLWRIKSTYKRDDIVFFQKSGESKELVKRVVGTPGDVLDINSDGEVLIDGQVIEEENVYFQTNLGDAAIELPIELGEGEYFVMGDNRINSRDSRMFGVVKVEEIDGQVVFVIRGKP